MQYEITRSETIPFLDSNGQVMQMKNFEIAITVRNDPNETLEYIEQQLEETFNKHRDIIANKIPLLETGKKRLNFLSEKLKTLLNESDYKKLIEQTKSIK